MISVFVHNKDLVRWRWKADASSDEFVQPKPRFYGTGKSQFGAAVRQSPIPSVILSPDDGDVASFIDWVRRTADASIIQEKMEPFVRALRKKISVCLPAVPVNNEPICVFIHFGGDFFVDANIRLGEAWSRSPRSLQDTFLCFAITVNGSREAGINGIWQIDTGDGKGNILKLPSDFAELKSVLDEGCWKWWGGECPVSFWRDNGTDSPLPQREIASPADRATTQSLQAQSNPDLPSPAICDHQDSDANKMSNLHVFVIADKGMCGGSDERCQQWIAKQRSCFEGFSYKTFDACIIPAWNGTMEAVREAYHGIARIVSAAIGTASPEERFVGVLDARKWPNMDKGKGMPSLKSVQGLLILAFPEVMWVPVFKNGEMDSKRWLETSLELSAGGFNPMFDGTGVRGTLIRSRKSTTHFYDRDDVAVTIDEERHFAELTAYTAFRFGYRAFPVSTERLAKQVLGVKAKTELPSFAGADVSSGASMVVFEDGDIEFPDCDQNDMHFLGSRRKESWPLLKTANLRVLATAAGGEERIAWSADKAAGKSTTEASEDNQPGKIEPNMTAREWFVADQVEDLGRGKKNAFNEWLEKCRRGAFNLFAGGMGGVWLWELVKVLLIIVALGTILVFCPGLLFLALFLVFVVFGLLSKTISGVLGVLFGRNARIRRALKVRLQWRFYPKLYTNHAPVKCGNLKGEKRYWRFVQKPLGGIFGLRNQCGLPNGCGFRGQLDKEAVKNKYREALNPQEKMKPAEGKDGTFRHSASGMTLDIAADLIVRARAMKNRGGGVEDAIHAAVLATCAYELLDGKTPALSVEALELRHYCEVMAECEFPGIRAQLDLKDRLIDIHNSLSQICRASNGDIREEMFESGMAAICDSISGLLRSRCRNEEAAFLSRQSRHMHRLLLPSFMRNLLAFPEWAVRSKLNFFFSLSVFLGVFAIYYIFRIDPGAGISDVLAKMYELLFSTQPNMDLTKIMTDVDPKKIGPIFGFFERLGLVKLEPIQTLQALEDKIASATVVVQAMRQLALIHIGFLAALFYDFMHRK